MADCSGVGASRSGKSPWWLRSQEVAKAAAEAAAEAAERERKCVCVERKRTMRVCWEKTEGLCVKG